MKHTIWLVLATLMLGSASVVGQVYESKDKSGAPVYSDQPTPGAKQVDLPAPNVATPQQAPSQAPAPPAPEFRYTQLGILAPAAQTTLHTNTGAFDVQLSLDPNLRTGDAIVLTLDGNTLPTRYTTASIALTEQDYASAAANTHQHSLAAAIVNANGAVLIQSDPVSFYVSRATVREGHRGR